MNISEKIIPVWSFDKGSWYRTDDLCSLFDNIVYCHDKSYRCTSAEDILGVKCNYIQKTVYSVFLIFRPAIFAENS